MKSEKQYIDFFEEQHSAINARSCALMNAQRDEAFEVFKTNGFPTQKAERYKYTDVAQAFSPNYGISLASPFNSSQLSALSSQLCHPIADTPIDITPYYNKIADTNDAVVALNNMLATDALVVYVPRYAHPEHPIQINNILKGQHDVMINRRILIILEEGAEANIIITDRAVDQRQFLTNQVIEAYAGENSHLNIYEIEETNLMCTRYSNVFIKEDKYASVRHTVLTLFNGHTRNRCDVQLAGEHSEVIMNGCVIADKMQRVDNNTLIDHQVSHCQSNELYKYVLDDSAVGAFAGRVLVRHGAQKTSSNEVNSNLCATKTARMYTQPMLEIYADDVKCSHGSTVGQLNDEALFYMRQRGISEKEARLLLKSAFITEVIDTIPLDSLRDRLQFVVDKRLRGELSKCEGCKLCK